jgi:amino acid transporter
MTTTAPPPRSAQPAPGVAGKGLKLGAIGLLSSIVIGVASTAPGYSLAAVLGGIAQEVGEKGPIIMLIAFVPILFISYAYKALNEETPDCGTNFTWTARVFGPRAGWLSGWALIAADIIVMASLAEIAALYTYSLFGIEASDGAVVALGIGWIIAMTFIAWRGIELSARTQYILLGAELIILAIFSVVALWQVYAGDAGDQAITPSLSWFNPVGLSFSALSAGFLLAVFIYWGWDSAVAANEETENPAINPGRAAVISTVVLVLTYVIVTIAAQAFAGVGTEGIGLANPENEDDVLSVVGEAAMGTWGVKLLIIAVLTSAAASTQTTILPTARATLAMAAYKALPKTFGSVHPRYQTPSVSTWAMGIVSAVFYGGLYFVSYAALSDLILSIGLLIAFYYGLTGFTAAWRYRSDLGAGVKPALQKVILPLLGGVILFVAMIKTGYDLLDPEESETTMLGVGGAFVLGIGSMLLGVILMIVYNLVAPAFFQGRTLRSDTVLTESGEFVPAEGERTPPAGPAST